LAAEHAAAGSVRRCREDSLKAASSLAPVAHSES
jgi:hypothetical protein